MGFEQVVASPGNRYSMATIGDVAKYAGVSRSTVSHALSGKRTISQATRERVNEAVRVLNYRANAGARALATARTMILALIVPFTPEEFAPATMQYVLVVTQTARSLGYDVLLVTQE
jgi:DNA-binding LacI/PurR family transcriptional regulator